MNQLLLFIMAIITTIGTSGSLTIMSPAFTGNGPIPTKYTCTGENVSPPLTISGTPKEAKSLALIVDDPDAPMGTFDHWVMWNIPVKEKIDENSAPGKEGLNGKKENKYTGPCPPSGMHHYHFKVYALDTKLDLDKNADKKALETAMKKHIVASGELVATYMKPKTMPAGTE